MKTEIKQRITQLNNGEVPVGYKKTEIGVFPSDWKNAKLGQISKMCGGGTPDTKKHEYWRGDIPWISSSDLIEDKLFQAHISRYVSKEAIINSATKLCPKDSIAVVTRVGLGKIALINVPFCTSQDFTNIIESSCDKRYLVYQIKNAINAKIRECQGTSIKGITVSDLQKVEINYPLNKEEQSKIAEILMKWDEAIEFQEQYVEKLELRKKVLSQKLLTSKIGWACEKLGNIAEMYAGGTPSTKKAEYWGGNIPWIQSGLIQNNYIDIDNIHGRITEQGLKKSSTEWIKKDSVLVAITGATCANIAYLKCDATANQSVISITTNSLNPLFLYFYLQNARNQLLSLQNGSAQGGLTLKYLQKFEILFPSRSEQKNIANILFNVDQEIILNTEKLEKLKKQRKTLQQYLLTGIVRVK